MPATVEETRRMAEMCQSVLSVISNELGMLGDIQARDAIQVSGVVLEGSEPFSRPLTAANRGSINARIAVLKAKINATAALLGVSVESD